MSFVTKRVYAQYYAKGFRFCIMQKTYVLCYVKVYVLCYVEVYVLSYVKVYVLTYVEGYVMINVTQWVHRLTP